MADAIGQVLALGVGVSLSPVPIIAVVLMLGTPRGRGSTARCSCSAGSSASRSSGTIVLVAASRRGAPTTPASRPTWVEWPKLVLGVLLLLVAVRQWRGRPQGGDDAALPKWMRTIDTLHAGRAPWRSPSRCPPSTRRTCCSRSAPRPRSPRPASTPADQAIALAVFILVGTLGPALPVAIYFALGARAKHILDELKLWLAAHNAAIMAVLCLVIGAKLIGDGISGLA